MLNEEQTEKQAGLGINVYNQPQEQQTQENQEDDGFFGKPEFYDYSGVELPENYCYDEEMLKEFNELAGKYNLSQKGADNLMSMAVKLTKLTGDSLNKTLAEQQRQKINEYKNALLTDREIGGANIEKTLKTANAAYDYFADDEVQKILQETGLNCHPKVVRMFYKIGKQMQNDTLYGMGTPALPKESREDILFPTMQ
jgi:hypothetical protein